MAQVQTLCASKGASLEVAISSDVASGVDDANNVIVSGDRQILMQCFANLLSNAFKFCEVSGVNERQQASS